MPSSHDSTELSLSLAELTAPTVAATTATTADQTAPAALASSDWTAIPSNNTGTYQHFRSGST